MDNGRTDGENAKLYEWLVRKLQEERVELEQRHLSMLAELGQHKAVMEAAFGRPKQPQAETDEIDMAEEAQTMVSDPLIFGRRGVSAPLSQVTPQVAEEEAARNEEEAARASQRPSQASAASKRASQRKLAAATSVASDAQRGSIFRQLEETVGQRPIWRPSDMIKSPFFDIFVAGLIVANACVIAVELQYYGMEEGYKLGYPKFDRRASQEWELAEDVFFVLEWTFGAIFAVELAAKLSILRRDFFQSLWNLVDAVLVLAWAINALFVSFLPLSPVWIRLARLARLLRLGRLLKNFQGMDSLYVLTTAIRGSMVVLTWSFAILMIIQLMLAFIVNQTLIEYFQNQDEPLEHRQELFMYFGTTARAMLTMFELTLANWPIPARALLESVGPNWIIVAIAHKLTIGFAVVGVVNGVFMQETFKSAAADDTIMMRQMEYQRKLHRTKMSALFAFADSSNDGLISPVEFKVVMNNPKVKQWLAAQGIAIDDTDELWRLLDNDGSEVIDSEEMIAGLGRLKGFAKSFEVAGVAHDCRVIRSMLESVSGPKTKNGSGAKQHGG